MTVEEILASVNESIDQLACDKKPTGLYEPIRYVLSMGGKRTRPILMMLAYNLYKDHIEEVLPSAIALETYHNYTLLHDDLMDQADMRRGKATVHKKWNANTAILSGDSMLVLAYQYMSQCNTKFLKDVLDTFTQTALEIGEGQQLDMDFEHRDDVTEQEYIEMIRLKTSVLLACALKIGAILADAPQKDIDNLYKFGEQIGLAFQLQDDYLDVYGDSAVFGKQIGGDIVSNKKTFMLIQAVNRATGNQKTELNQWLNAKTFNRDEKVAAITAIYNQLRIDRLAQEKIEYYFNESKRYLDAIQVAEERKQELASYVMQMMNRNY